MKRTLIMSVLAAVLILSSGFAFAAGQDEQIYGSQLMTQQERIEYRTKMRAAKTAQEREQIRNEYHEQLKERAKESGVTLPDEPPGRGGGMGPGGVVWVPVVAAWVPVVAAWVPVVAVWGRVGVVATDIA